MLLHDSPRPATAPRDVRFGLYLKVWVALAALVGVVLGVLSLINAVKGGSTTASFLSARFEGTTAGFINIVWIPALFALGAIVVSPLMYFPFRSALRLAGVVMMDPDEGRESDGDQVTR